MLEQKIEDLLLEKFKEEAFADCFLVEISLQGQKRLEVFFDCDSGVTFSKCKQLSRFLEEHIEANEWLPAKYTIEVSSPGIGRPLSHPRQYQNNIGRLVEVTLHDGSTYKGTLKEVHPDRLLLEEKVGKKGQKKKQIKEIDLPFDQIKKTKVKVSF